MAGEGVANDAPAAKGVDESQKSPMGTEIGKKT